VLIFLDFDGVLRRKDAPFDRFERPLLRTFEAAVRRIPDARIVITSTWREVVDFVGLRKLFSPDVAERIVGVTPILPGGRYREVQAYLEEHSAETIAWVGIDDDPVSYPRGAPVILVDPARGFGPEEGRRLEEMALAFRKPRA
jgi:hypothetical protein